MSTITLKLPDDDAETRLTAEEWALVDEALEQVEEGKVKPHDKAAIMARAEELLKEAGLV